MMSSLIDTLCPITDRFLVLETSLDNVEISRRPLLAKAIADQIQGRKGEYLYSAPPELPEELQIAANRAFQRSFDDLSGKVLQALEKHQDAV